MKIPVLYDRTGDPSRRGGFADVWRGKHNELEVAVKVLRTYSDTDFGKITGVGC